MNNPQQPIKIPPSLRRLTGRAIQEFSMIQPNDRILLGLSGGKDSLTLLHILNQLRHYAPIKFDLGACTIDPLMPTFDPSTLQGYLKALKIPFYLEKTEIYDQAKSCMDNDSYCSFCARMKRGHLYTAARRENYNVIALAHHLDDLAESFFMSLHHGGRLQTMKAHYIIDSGDLRVIRPMVFVRERQTADFAIHNALPIIEENCPACFSHPNERARMKQFLANEESANPHLFKSLLTAIKPLMKNRLPEF